MRISSKWIMVLGILAAFIVTMGTTALAADEVKIGYTAPFTGSAAEFGTNGWRGVQIALDEINEKGLMIDGKKYTIDIIRYDSICTPTDGVANVRKLIMQDKVSAILGDHCSSVCNAIAPLCQQFKVPGITIECASDNVTQPGHDYYFRMRPSVGLMAPLFTPALVEKFQPKKAGYLVVNDDYGLGLASAVMENFKKAGVPSDEPEAFERGTTDFTVFLAKLKQAGVDVVFYAGSASEGAMILKQAAEMGLTKDVKFVGSEEMGEMELLSLAGPEAVEGTYAVSLWGEVPAAFAETVKSRFNAPMHYAIIFGYDALHTVAKAIEAAQSTDPKKIQAAMKAIVTEGIAGHIQFYDFDGFKNQGKASPSLIQWKDGKRLPM
jgi:branched-chain amino acid transport system substrate-binding protein